MEGNMIGYIDLRVVCHNVFSEAHTDSDFCTFILNKMESTEEELLG